MNSVRLSNKLTFEMGGLLLPTNGIFPSPESLSFSPPAEKCLVLNNRCIACLKASDLVKLVLLRISEFITNISVLPC